MIDTSSLMGAAETVGIITPLVIGVTAMVKKAGAKKGWAKVLIALIAGFGLAFVALGYTQIAIFVGLISSLSAMGLYSGVKAVVQG